MRLASAFGMRDRIEATSQRLMWREIRPAPENLLNRDFSAAAPSQKWFIDISNCPLARSTSRP